MEVIYWEINGRPDYAIPVPGSGLTIQEVAARAVPEGISWTVKDFETAKQLFDAHPENRRMMLAPLPKWRFEAIIDIYGLRQDIEDAIASLPDQEKAVIYAKRHYVTEFHRTDPLFEVISQKLGISQTQIDDMWQEATNL